MLNLNWVSTDRHSRSGVGGGLLQAVPHSVLVNVCAVLLEELQAEDTHHKSLQWTDILHMPSHHNQKLYTATQI